MASGLRPRPYLSAFRVFGCPQALQGSLSFSCVTGGSHLRLRLDEPPPAICLSSSGLSNSARCARGVETTNSHFSADFIAQNGNLLPPTVPPAGAGSIFFTLRNEWLRLRLRLRLHRLAIDMPPVARAHSFALKARAAAYAELCYLCDASRGTHKFVCRNSSLVFLQIAICGVSDQMLKHRFIFLLKVNFEPPTVPPVSRVRIMLSIGYEWFRRCAAPRTRY